jgi:UDP-N-acetylmuramate dehydrogenase
LFVSIYIDSKLMPLEISENVPLAPLTTLGVGGNARFFAVAKQDPAVEEAVAFAREKNLKLFVLGGGSNLVVSDRGWDGLILQIAIPGIKEESKDGKAIFHVGAGVNWDEFVAHCVLKNCAGLECMSGIPGSVGGTPVQNVGAYGQEVSETIVSVLAFDTVENQVRELKSDECCFTYRSSIFNTTHRGRHVIVRVSYALQPEGKARLQYGDLQKHFGSCENAPTLAEVREAVRKIRAGKGMLITPGDPDSCSAGSFFKNPVLSQTQYAALVAMASERNLQVPNYPALAQHRKISAAWLVDKSGFRKGLAWGQAGISSKHALAIVNRGGATAAEILALKNEIQTAVERTWGIVLDPEPVFVGF